MEFVILASCFIIIGMVVLLRERRSFFGGMSVAFGSIFLTLTLLSLLLVQIGEVSNKGSFIVLMIVYLLFPVLFLGVSIFFIVNTHIMNTKDGRSVTAKLSALLGLNLLIVVPAFFYLITI